MKLALVGEHYGFDAASEVLSGCHDLAGLTLALSERGHDVRVYTAATTTAAAVDGPAVIAMPVGRHRPGHQNELMPMIADMVRSLLAAWSIDPPQVVHAQGWGYGVAAQLTANRLSVPTVQVFDGVSVSEQRHRRIGHPPTARGRLEALLAKNATKVATSCHEDMFDTISMGCARERAAVLARGTDIDAFEVSADITPRDTHRARVVAVAPDRLDAADFDVALRALMGLPGTELVLAVGRAAPRTTAEDNRERQAARRLRTLASRLGVAGRLRIVGVADGPHLAALLRSADIVMCCAAYDPCARIALAAMACGVPVVATGTGALLDVVVHDVTGLLVPPMNSDALARAVRSLLGHGVLRQGMGLAGRSRARSRYAWSRVAADAETLYQSAISSGPRRHADLVDAPGRSGR